MPSTVTVTGKIGPADAVTALVISNVDSFAIDCDKALLSVTVGTEVQQFDITGKSTLTLTQSGGAYALTVA